MLCGHDLNFSNKIEQPECYMFMVNSIIKLHHISILPSCMRRIWVNNFLQTGGTFHWRIFTHSMRKSFCYNSLLCCQFVTKICTCHDRSAVVTCVNICRDYFVEIRMRSVENSIQIWIAAEIPLVLCAPRKMKCGPPFSVPFFLLTLIVMWQQYIAPSRGWWMLTLPSSLCILV